MTSAVTPSRPSNQRTEMSSSPPPPPPPVAPLSPPSKRADLKSWWKKFQVQPGRHHETRVVLLNCFAFLRRFLSASRRLFLHLVDAISQPRYTAAHFGVHKVVQNSASPLAQSRAQGIFGVPLRQSITYANVAISLIDENGQSYIYGYVPIVVAKCGVYLKEKATSVEGIFRLNGSEKRIKELKIQFDSPDRYGKGLVWDGYTVHDAANVLRRYLNDLPEPVVPLDLYERFREPLRGHTKQAVGDTEGTQLLENFNQQAAVKNYQELIKELPPLNRQLLLYILDLLAVFAAKSDENRMTAQNLAAIFQPGMLSHPQHAMAPEEYRLNQCVIIFLIENQDHFLIGMQGTGADEQTKQEIENGTPTIIAPTTPTRQIGVARSASNASAGAESVTRDGTIRRNRSTSSRRSRYSNGAPTPGSPSMTSPGGLNRSNTVPSKKSPLLPSGQFASRNSPVVGTGPDSPFINHVDTAPTAGDGAFISPDKSPTTSTLTPMDIPSQNPGHSGAGRSQERLLAAPGSNMTPSKERNLQSLFQRSPNSDGEKRQPNKLRKKRLPSANPSAQSSTTSLTHSAVGSSTVEASDPVEKAVLPESAPPEKVASVETSSEPISLKASQLPPAGSPPINADHRIDSLKPKLSDPISLRSSFNGSFDVDHPNEATHPSSELAEKEKKHHWRISRRKEDVMGLSGQNLSNHSHAEMSSSTVGNSPRPRKSWNGDASELPAGWAESEARFREKDDTKGPIGWIRHKYREAKENADKRAKSPPASEHIHGFLPTRNKSPDSRSMDERGPAASQPFIPETSESNPVPPSLELLPSDLPPPVKTPYDEKLPNP
ncbi:hypothetical protein GGR50DRAFT_614787 [Xylaria sp. CBS 124048]|nr:hypothetical protein GGR50DRAFT_614787 [Xylaria sp. CBS 124048]